MGLMGSRNKHNLWRSIIRRKLFRSSSSSRQHDTDSIIVLHSNDGRFSEEFSSSAYEENVGSDFLSREDIAAITIQTCFRGHLARRAFRALTSLVKLQAVARGVIVRRQSRIALQCMHALARLHLTVQARLLLRA